MGRLRGETANTMWKVVFGIIIVGVVAVCASTLRGQSTGIVEMFDGLGMPPVALLPGSPTSSIPGGLVGYSFSNGTAGRARIVNDAIVAAGVPPATGGNGPDFLVLDRAQTGSDVTNEITFTFDGLSLDQNGTGVRVRFLLRDLGDELDPEDVVAVDDGTTVTTLLLWNFAPIQTAWGEFSFDLSPLIYPSLTLSSTMRLIFRQRDDFPAPSDGLAIDFVRIEPAPIETDLGAVSVGSPGPTTCAAPTSLEPVVVVVENFGNTMLAAGEIVTFAIVVDGGPATADFAVLPASLPPGGTVTLTTINVLDLSAPGTHTVTVSASVTGDTDTSNDAAPTVSVFGPTANVVVNFPYVESFDGLTWNGSGNGSLIPPLSWRQSTTDGAGLDSDWWFRNIPTPSIATGPTADHTTGIPGVGYFAYAEDAGSFAGVELISPCFDLQFTANPIARFFIAFFNGGTTPSPNLLHVDVVVHPTRTVFLDVIPPIAPEDDRKWHARAVDLLPFVGNVVEIVFRASTAGGGTSCDIAIDDFFLGDEPVEGGQPSSVGARLSIGDARNLAGFSPLDSSRPGPFRVRFAASAVMPFSIVGPPNLPLVFVAGIPNVAAFSAGGFGQLDVGNFPFSSSASLWILGDGLTAGSSTGPVFILPMNGITSFSALASVMPLSIEVGFQAAIFDGQTPWTATNAVFLKVD